MDVCAGKASVTGVARPQPARRGGRFCVAVHLGRAGDTAAQRRVAVPPGKGVARPLQLTPDLRRRIFSGTRSRRTG
jgi:hypothetical protein